MKAKYRVMLKAVFRILRFILLIFAGHKEVALENAALRAAVGDPQNEIDRVPRCTAETACSGYSS